MRRLYLISFLFFFRLFAFVVSTRDDRTRQNQILNSQTSSRSRQEKLKHDDSCKGILPWTCSCQPEVLDETNSKDAALRVESISCSNSDFVETEILKTLQTFSQAQSATFYGNNFLTLPERFSGATPQKSLLYLNLSGNNFLYLHQDSLLGVPSLQSLDLSENNINLRHESGDYGFLRPVRFLRRLLLRRAFRRQQLSGENSNSQLISLETGLRHAHLSDLQFLDLSHNSFDQFPSKLICWTPALTHLILKNNRFRTLRFDDRCPVKELRVIDLRSNRFVYFSPTFSRTADRLPTMSIEVNDNPFDCSSKTCSSKQSMIWFRTTNTIKDKDRVRCRAAIGEESENNRYNDYLSYAMVDTDLQCPAHQSVSSGHEKQRENLALGKEKNKEKEESSKESEKKEQIMNGNLTSVDNSASMSKLGDSSMNQACLLVFTVIARWLGEAIFDPRFLYT